MGLGEPSVDDTAGKEEHAEGHQFTIQRWMWVSRLIPSKMFFDVKWTNGQEKEVSTKGGTGNNVVRDICYCLLELPLLG